jgi:ribosomal protein L37AE/L43A
VENTDIDKIAGQNKCAKCGATDISPNIENGLLRCNFCRHEFDGKVHLDEDINQLDGIKISSGASQIYSESHDELTLKCDSCAAEVVINTNEVKQARCHWCRNTLSIQQQIPNGAIPDVVLPFKLPKETAKDIIQKFVTERQFYAHPRFKKEFEIGNIFGIYLPYMIIDVKAHSTFIGQGEVLIREYTVGSGDDEETNYDAELYDIEREADIIIDDLIMESNTDKRQNKNSNKTNNIINSILPFDTENCVKWDANYLQGFSSERRDSEVETLKSNFEAQVKDITRHKMNETLSKYNRGVRWKSENTTIKGESWKTAYLPIWLYSYHEKSKNELHYIAVNARTKERMGSIPIYFSKLILISAIIEFFSFILWIVIQPFVDSKNEFSWLLMSAGFINYFVVYNRYRNRSARHFHEKETRVEMNNLRVVDTFNKKETGLSNSRIAGENGNAVKGNLFK